MVKTVTSGGQATHSHALPWSSRHDVSSMWADLGLPDDRGGQLGDGRLQDLGGLPLRAWRSCPARSTARTGRRPVAGSAAWPGGTRRPAGQHRPAAGGRRRPVGTPGGTARRWRCRSAGRSAGGADTHRPRAGPAGSRRPDGAGARGSSPGRARPQRRQCVGLDSRRSRGPCSGGTNGRVWRLMAGLPATLRLPEGAAGGRSLDGGGIGRRRLGGVGGVLVEPLFEVSDPFLQLVDDPGDHRLGVGGEGVPDVLRDRSRPGHTIIIGGPIGQGNPSPWTPTRLETFVHPFAASLREPEQRRHTRRVPDRTALEARAQDRRRDRLPARSRTPRPPEVHRAGPLGSISPCSRRSPRRSATTWANPTA